MTKTVNQRVVTCYLDESATDGGTPQAVVGGVVLNRSGFLSIDPEWNELLVAHNLLPALHMKDFGLHGRFAKMDPGERAKVFDRAAKLINEYKIYSLAVTIEHARYQEALGSISNEVLSVYGLGFIAMVAANHNVARRNGYSKNISYVIDTGNPYAEHVRTAHATFTELQHSRPLNLGGLMFESDERVNALQAADVVCWGARRRAAGCLFTHGFEPIQSILEDSGHGQEPISESVMMELLKGVREATNV